MFNMFVPELEAQGRSLYMLRDACSGLISRPERAFEHLIGQMLDECRFMRSRGMRRVSVFWQE